MRRALAALAMALAPGGSAAAAEVRVAAAANITPVAEQIAAAFEAETGHELVLSFGSTGQLYAQIVQGAPFEVFLAADAEHPALAVAAGLALAGTAFTYARGRLALYSPTLDVAEGAVLRGDFERLAIADPELAPYGRAAVETLAALGLREAMTERLVVATNISQALQFVVSGNAELGFVAVGQVGAGENVWLVPESLHAPIRQDAVLLQAGAGNPAAPAFLQFLRGDEAVRLLQAAGYAVN